MNRWIRHSVRSSRHFKPPATAGGTDLRRFVSRHPVLFVALVLMAALLAINVGSLSKSAGKSERKGPGKGSVSVNPKIQPLAVPVGTTYTVNVVGDTDDVNIGDGICQDINGKCTLRAALEEANAIPSDDTITFSVSGTITLGSTLPTIVSGQGTLTVDGAGQSVTISGNNSVQVLFVNSGANVTLQNVTIANGNSGSSVGGGIENNGTLTVTNSTFSNNTASGFASSGGGIFNASGSTLTVTNSTFSGNSADSFGGGIDNRGTLSVTNSTFSGNSAGGNGGGIFNSGTLNVTNSTFSGNSAPSPGGGIFNQGTATLKNTIVANSTSGGNCSNFGTLTADSFNMADDSTCGSATQKTSAQINLGALANNGGPTQTMALQTSPTVSAAIDAGDDAVCVAAVGSPNFGAGGKDQRGVTRPQGAHCDIGAFEVQNNTPPTITAGGPLARQQGSAASNSQIATVSDADQTANTLTVTATPLTGSGVTVNNISVDVSGNVTADVAASCTATNSTFTLTVTDNANATATDILTVNVTATATPTITPGGPTTFCAGGNVKLTSSSASGNQWKLNGSPIGGETNQDYTATASGSYTVTVTDGNGCSATSAPTTVTVNPLPATPTITPGGSTTFCAGGNVKLTSSSASGNQWKLNGSPIGGETNQDYTATASGNYTVTVTDGNGCSATSAPTTVTVQSNSITVINTNDSGNGSLRQAILDVCASGGTINFDPALTSGGPATITLTSGELLIDKVITINGPTNNGLTIGNNPNVNASRIFNVNTGKSLSISFLTIANGQAAQGGGIFNAGTLTITNSTLSGNVTPDGADATGAANGGNSTDGGAIYSTGTLTLINSTISGNKTGRGGDNLIGSGNAGSSGNGAGVYSTGTVTLTNATITNNQIGRTGRLTSCSVPPDPPVPCNSTGTNGNTGIGGGVRNSGGTLTLNNTIVATNKDGFGDSDDVHGTATSSSFNLIGSDAGLSGISDGSNGNQVGTSTIPLSPHLGALTNNGGPTQTQLPDQFSPAIDAGSNAFITNPPFSGPPFTDQRGTGFPRNINGGKGKPDEPTVDIGAVEAPASTAPPGADLTVTKSVDRDTVVPDRDLTYTIVATNNGADPATSAGLTDNLPQVTNNTDHTDTNPPTYTGTTFQSFTAPAGWSCIHPSMGSTGTFSCTKASFAGVSQQTFTLVVHVPPTAMRNEGDPFISNSVSVDAANDTNTENNSGSAVTQLFSCITDPIVTKNTDNGPGSLRQAIADACVGSTITFDTTQFPSPITLTTSELLINKNLTIQGPGANLLTIRRSGAASNFRIFEIQSGKTVNISGLTISNGQGVACGGFNCGGGILNNGGTVTLTNSTLSGNSASGGSTNQGGGIYNNGGTVKSRNTIISGNSADSGPDVNGTFSSQGHNFIGKSDGSSGFTDGNNGDQVGTVASPKDPKLGAFANNGGATQTYLLLPGSTAINAGDNCVFDNSCSPALAAALTTDQRGFNRVVNTTVDIGAVEVNYSITATAGTPQSATINTAFATALKANLTESGNAQNGISVTFTAPASGASGAFPGPSATAIVSTNSSGDATAPIFTANGTGGSYNVVASIGAGMFTATFALTNNKINQTITFGALTNKTYGNPDFTVSATASSGLTVSFAASGNCTVSVATVHITGAGACTITASQAGDASFNAATPVPQLFNIAKAATATAVSSSLNPSNVGQNVTFTATVTSTAGTPTGTVQFKDGGANIGPAQTLNGSGVATFPTTTLVAGIHTITAAYSGDANFVVSTGTLSGGQQVGSIIKFSTDPYSTTENSGFTTITVQRIGDLSQAVTVDYATPDDSSAMTVLPCSTANGVALPRCDFTTALGTLRFGAGDGASKTFTVLINQDNFVEGPESLTLTLSNLTGGAGFTTPGATSTTATLTIADDLTEPAGNPNDVTDTFVRQHYRDFLSREPDAPGLAFWKDNIDKCNDPARRPAGLTVAQCIEVFRINTSAAFFLSIEFQNTGYYVERMYKAGFGDIGPPTVPVPVRFTDFLRDTQRVDAGVIVGQGSWQAQLDANKAAYALEFVQRPAFLARYPALTSATAFVDSLNGNAGSVLNDTERSALIAELAPNPSDSSPRADVLRKIADNALLQQREFNRAFVLMQYFGYLRRNPDAAPELNLNFDGYNFWLNKLNQFNGNFINAEMVKAFISSIEYRQRFGP